MQITYLLNQWNKNNLPDSDSSCNSQDFCCSSSCLYSITNSANYLQLKASQVFLHLENQLVYKIHLNSCIPKLDFYKVEAKHLLATRSWGCHLLSCARWCKQYLCWGCLALGMLLVLLSSVANTYPACCQHPREFSQHDTRWVFLRVWFWGVLKIVLHLLLTLTVFFHRDQKNQHQE